jgi:hypothetical protein
MKCILNRTKEKVSELTEKIIKLSDHLYPQTDEDICKDCNRYNCEGCPENKRDPIDYGDDERAWGYDGDCL